MKRLTLVRHAKSSWKDASLADFDRPLNKRGRRAAPEMARRLAERGFDPDLLVSSPALRARETTRAIAEEIDLPLDEVRWDPEIYEASLGALIALVRDLDDDWEAVALVGHNPGFTELANYLAGTGIVNVPTAGVVDLELEVGSWAEVDRECGRLRWFGTPKDDAP